MLSRRLAGTVQTRRFHPWFCLTVSQELPAHAGINSETAKQNQMRITGGRTCSIGIVLAVMWQPFAYTRSCVSLTRGGRIVTDTRNTAPLLMRLLPPDAALQQ